MSSTILNQLRFPSGLTVGTARKEAQRLKKSSGDPLHKCLDRIAQANGSDLGWSKAIERMFAIAVYRAGAEPPAMTESDIRTISSRHPDLTQYGFGVPRRLGEERPYQELLARERETNHWLLPKCNLALAYISMLSPQKEINRQPEMASIELKHYAESALKLVRPARDNYIQQGAFIMAALHRGFLIQLGPGGLYVGAFFNIKYASAILHWPGTFDDELAQELMRHLVRLGIEQ